MSGNRNKVDYALPELPQIPVRTFTITDYGAEDGGLSLCTSAIQSALDACAAAGGGKVVIPPGIWRTGPLTLRSRINLCAERGALVLFDPDPALYPLISSHFEGTSGWRCQAPLDGEGLSDVAVTGEGIFDGSGEGWRPVKRFKMTELQWNSLTASGERLITRVRSGGLPVKPWRERQSAKCCGRAGDGYGGLSACPRVSPSGAAQPAEFPAGAAGRANLQNSPAWCLHPLGCEHITVRNIRVRNPWYSQNGDGLDLESCTHALVEHCSFDVGDDAICLKSGKDEEGRRLGMPCRYITIRHCTVYHGHGGVVIGSEMSGGVHAVRVSDCVFIGTDIGLRFKSTRGRGGVVEDIVIENIRMSGILHEAVSFHMFYEGVEGSEGYNEQHFPVTEATPQFRNIALKNIVCHGAATALLVNGLPEMPLAGLSVENFHAVSERGIVLRHADSLSLDRIQLQTAKLPKLQMQQCSNVSLLRSEDLEMVE